MTDWYAEVTKPTAPAIDTGAAPSAPEKVDWYNEVAGSRAPVGGKLPGGRLARPEGAPEGEPAAIYSPDKAASMSTVAAASLASDPKTRVQYYAKQRGIDPADYQIINGAPAYKGEDGKMYFEEPSGHFFPRSLTEAGGMAAQKVGPSMPMLAGGVTGVATSPMLLTGPLGMAGSMAATGGAAAGGEAVRQGLANQILGEEFSPGRIAGEGAIAAAGQGVGAGLTGFAQRHAAQDIAQLNPMSIADIRRKAAAQGIELTPAEETGLATLRAQQKYLNNSTRSQNTMQEFYDRRGGQVDDAIQRFLDRVSSIDSAEVAGGMGRTAARRALDASPEARAVREAEGAIGPRVTPEAAGGAIAPAVGENAAPLASAAREAEFATGAPVTPEAAGNAIRTDLAGTAERRAGMRSALGNADYDAARASGEVIDTDPVITLIAGKLAEVKGKTKDAVEHARQLLMVGKAPDTSVSGLIEADREIGDLVKAARASGQTNTVHHLEEIQTALRGQLDSAPQAGQARRNYAAASRPLDPFQEGVVGQALARDEHGQNYKLAVDKIAPGILKGGPVEVDRFLVATENQPGAREAFQSYVATEARAAARAQDGALDPRRMSQWMADHPDVMDRFPGLRLRLENAATRAAAHADFVGPYAGPVEQIAPGILRGGPAAVDDFLRVTENQPAAHRAFESYLSTEIRGAATSAEGRVNPGALRKQIADNEDVLNRFPGVRDRLDRLAAAAERHNALGDTMTGRLADMGEGQLGKAAQTLFGANSGPKAIGEARSQLETADPHAWQALKRAWIQDVFEKSSQEYASNYGNAANTAGKFTAALKGNIQTMARLKAALSPEEFTALEDLTSVLKAASRVKPVGSDTEFNRLITEAERDKARPLLAKIAGNINPAQALRNFDDWLTNRAMGGNAEKLAEIVTQPGAADRIRSLRLISPNSVAFRVGIGHLISQGSDAAVEGALK